MILNPATAALTVSSVFTAGFACYAAVAGRRIARRWDLGSGSEEQLQLERKTYLMATILNTLFGIQVLALFLFVRTAEAMHPLFVGAMCAAGSFNASAYGYPALMVKLLSAVLCGIWLIVNAADNRAPDYPLVRRKYRFLPGLAALLLLEAYLQTGYFMDLRPDVITSCCGALFSEYAASVAGAMAAWPARPAMAIFYLMLALVFRLGVQLLWTGRPAQLFSAASVAMTVVSIAAVVSFISVYVYELPTHHCPFCLLQSEYRLIGYPLYAALLAGGIAGGGVGVLDRIGNAASLRAFLPEWQRRLCSISLAGFLAFALMATYPILFSDFSLEG